MFSVYYGECTLVLVFCVGCEACTPVLMFCVGCGSAPWSLCFACIVWSVLWPWTEPCSQLKLSCCLESFQISGSNTGYPSYWVASSWAPTILSVPLVFHGFDGFYGFEEHWTSMVQNVPELGFCWLYFFTIRLWFLGEDRRNNQPFSSPQEEKCDAITGLTKGFDGDLQLEVMAIRFLPQNSSFPSCALWTELTTLAHFQTMGSYYAAL